MVVICSYGFCGGWWMGQLGNGFSLFLCYNTCSFDISTFFFSVFVYMVTKEMVEKEKIFGGSNLVMSGAW